MKAGTVAVRAAGGWDPVAGRLPGPLLVLVSAETGAILDPLRDITALLRPTMVIRGGVVVSPDGDGAALPEHRAAAGLMGRRPAG